MKRLPPEIAKELLPYLEARPIEKEELIHRFRQHFDWSKKMMISIFDYITALPFKEIGKWQMRDDHWFVWAK